MNSKSERKPGVDRDCEAVRKANISRPSVPMAEKQRGSSVRSQVTDRACQNRNIQTVKDKKREIQSNFSWKQKGIEIKFIEKKRRRQNPEQDI